VLLVSGMMWAMRRQAGLLGFGLITALVAAVACTGHGDNPNTSSASLGPPVSTSVSSSTRPAPSPTNPYPADVPLTGHNVKVGEKPPVYPAAAKVRSQSGANAFAEFFMRTLDWAYATTNPSYMKHYYASSCGQCNGLATGIRNTQLDLHWYLGGRLTVHSATATGIAPVSAPADFCAALRVDITATSVVDKTGKIFNGDGAYNADHFKLCAKMTSSSWKMTYMARTS
jgi:hypothetical protein